MGGGAEREGQADSALSAEPNAGLDLMTLRLRPELKSRVRCLGRLGGAAVKRLPSAQGVIPTLWDRAPHHAPLL